MSSLNKRTKQVPTEVNEVGTPVFKINAKQELQRLTFAYLLFEDQFYIDGKRSADKLIEAVGKVSPQFAQQVAIEARTKYKLRHVPLLITAALIKNGTATVDGIAEVIQRADEMGELLAIYNRDGKRPLANKLKKGIAKAFLKFNEFQLAKNDKNSAAYSIRDVMFLTHPKPTNKEQADLFKRIADQDMFVPETWETELSAGADKKVTFEYLMANNKMGALAFLRNLRNMSQAGVDRALIRTYGKSVNVDKVLPYQFITAQKYAPEFTDMLEQMMFKALENIPKLPGRTVLVVDTSGSMGASVSSRSELTRLQAAAAITILAREICEEVVIYATAGDDRYRKHATMLIPSYRGFALADFITGTKVSMQIGGGGIFLLQCMDYIANEEKDDVVDRVIVFTDEQDTGGRGFEPHNAKRLGKTNYILNVGAYQNGVNHKDWTTVTGFSEATLAYIAALEGN